VHYLLDFGAGTLDAAVFICHRAGGQDVISIIASDVSRLGTHYLLASLVGSAGQKLSWRDGDADRTPGSIAATTGEAEQQIQARLASYKSLVRRSAYQAFVDARRLYQTGDVMLGRRPFPVLLCGGGARLRETRANMNLLSREFTKIGRPPLDISELPRPARDELIAPMGFDYDRLAVAHGLCELSRNLGTVQGMKGVEPVLAGERTEVDDRDATR
jgi:hypothetical protein